MNRHLLAFHVIPRRITKKKLYTCKHFNIFSIFTFIARDSLFRSYKCLLLCSTLIQLDKNNRAIFIPSGRKSINICFNSSREYHREEKYYFYRTNSRNYFKRSKDLWTKSERSSRQIKTILTRIRYTRRNKFAWKKKFRQPGKPKITIYEKNCEIYQTKKKLT